MLQVIGNSSLTHKKLFGNFLSLNAIRQHTQNLLFGFCQFLYIDPIFFKEGGAIIYCFQNVQQSFWLNILVDKTFCPQLLSFFAINRQVVA